MSQIALPAISTVNSNAGADEQPVNLESCKTITKKTREKYATSTPGVAKDVFEITFHFLDVDNQTKEISWLYNDEGVRDTDYDNAKAAFATPI